MSATCLEIIVRAMRRLGLLAAGETPQDSEAQDALGALQARYLAWAADGMFRRLDQIVNGDEALQGAVYAPPAPDALVEVPVLLRDSETGRQVPPPDLALVEAVAAETAVRQLWLYDARRGGWVRLDGLKLDDEAPLSRRSPEGLAAVLAEEIADEFQGALGAQTARLAGAFRWSISSRYGEARSTAGTDYF
ncbi:MAG: hypothetical protein SNJ62_04905 [Chloracidobacterium sp.]